MLKRIAIKLAILCLFFQAETLLAADPIDIGAIFSLSSWGADGGSSELNGARMAQDDINAAGGIGGRELRLIVEDNRSDLKASVSAFKKLVSVDKVPVLIGPNWTEFTEVVAPLAEDHRIPMITPSGYRKNVISSRAFVFSLWPPPNVATAPLSDYILRKGNKKIAVLISENAYYEGLLHAIQEQLHQIELKIMRFNEGTLDYRSHITRLKSSDIDAVLALLMESGDLSSFFRQAKQLKLKFPIYAANGIPFSEAIKSDPEIANGVIYFDYKVPGKDSFRKRYEKRFSQKPGFASAQAYDALYIIKKAIEDCGLEPEKIKECIKNTSMTGQTGKIVFDEGGVIKGALQNSYLLQVVDGEFKKM